MTGAAKTRRTRTRLDPEVRRGQILDVAEQLFAGRDPSGVTLEEISEAAGISRALVYNYFGDKSGVVAAVYLRSSQRLDEALARAPQPADPSERLGRIIAISLQFAAENPAAWRLIGTAEAATHPLVQAARRTRREQMAALLGGTAEAHVVARGVIGFIEAATLTWLDRPELPMAEALALIHATLWDGLSSVVGDTADQPLLSTARQQYQATTLR